MMPWRSAAPMEREVGTTASLSRRMPATSTAQCPGSRPWQSLPSVLKVKKPVYPSSQTMNSSDEVDLVNHASNLTSGDTDKHTLVQPVKFWCRRLDLR
jgi:hypothetical protein